MFRNFCIDVKYFYVLFFEYANLNYGEFKDAESNYSFNSSEFLFKGTIKTGRTHLMDAMPIEFSQELSGWSAQLKSCKTALLNANQRIRNS